MKLSRRSLIKGILGAVCLGTLPRPPAVTIVQPPVACGSETAWTHNTYYLDSEVMYVRREAFMLEFFTYETETRRGPQTVKSTERFTVARRVITWLRSGCSTPAVVIG